MPADPAASSPPPPTPPPPPPPRPLPPPPPPPPPPLLAPLGRGGASPAHPMVILNAGSPGLLDARNKSGHDEEGRHAEISRGFCPRGLGGMARRKAQAYGSCLLAETRWRLSARQSRRL